MITFGALRELRVVVTRIANLEQRAPVIVNYLIARRQEQFNRYFKVKDANALIDEALPIVMDSIKILVYIIPQVVPGRLEVIPDRNRLPGWFCLSACLLRLAENIYADGKRIMPSIENPLGGLVNELEAIPSPIQLFIL